MSKNTECKLPVLFSTLNWQVNAEELPEYLLLKQKDWAKTQYGPKSIVDRFLAQGAGFFPDKLIITRNILSVNDANGIQKQLREGIKHNYSMGVRSVADRQIFNGGKLEWDLEIDSDEKVAHFLHITLPSWQINAASNNYKISQLILMNNPSEIGIKEDQQNQFVFRVRWDDFDHGNSMSSRLLVEMVVGTNKLRTLDQLMEDGNENVIRYQLLYRPTGFVDKIELQIGSSYRKNSSLHQKSDNLVLNEPLSKIKLDEIDETSAETILTVLSQINNLIKDPNIQFLQRLKFFANLGLNIIEFQGFVNKIGQRKMFIYGLRGDNDDTKTGLHS